MRALPPIHAASHHSLGILDGNLPMPASMNTIAATTASIRPSRKIISRRLSSPVSINRKVLTIADGSRATIPAKDDQRDTIADTALGDLLPKPHDKAVPAVSVSTVIRRKDHPGSGTNFSAPVGTLPLLSRPRLIPRTLHSAEDNGAVACILSDFLRPCSPSFFSFSR